MNDYYAFDDERRAIVVKRHDTPAPWINYLSNGTMHAFVSQAGGGFAWWKSPVVLRLTRYRQYNLPIDSPGFYVYVRTPDGTYWSPSFRPCETPLDEWSATHTGGRTRFEARKGDLAARLEFTVAPDHDVLLWDLRLENRAGAAVACDVFAYCEFSQPNWEGEAGWGYYLKLQLKTWYERSMDAVAYLYHGGHPREDDCPLMFLGSSRPADSYCGDRDAFVGQYRYERNPVAVERGACGDVDLPCGQPCGAVHNRVRITPGGSERITFFLGVAPGALVDLEAAKRAGAETLRTLRASGAVDEQFAKVAAWWDEHWGVLSCDIPDADARRQIETWTPLNTVHTGRYSRAVNTVAPGIRGIGFRDTCQDMLAVAYRKPAWASGVLSYLLTQQFEDGHVVHYAYPEERKPPLTTVHSDDHLWLPFVAHAIAAETGDVSFLDARARYLADDAAGAGGEATQWEHLLATVRFTEANLGALGIPLTHRSDWNDIIGKYNKRGRGQTVFAAQQYVVALRYLIAIAAARGDDEARAWLGDCLARQAEAIVTCAWDGAWWRRGFDDDLNPVGTHAAEAGRLYLNPQSWAVLSGVGSDDQLRVGMDAVAEHLATDVGLKILTPGFSGWGTEGGTPRGYGPGCGENGAIFCHSNTWAIMAEALLGRGARAWRYFTQIIPHVAMRTVGVERYRAEPYAWVSNIVGPENDRHGWANVTQVTGTAAWMDVAATQYLLGVRPEIAGLRIDPCIPADWPRCSVTRRWRGCELRIEVDNAAGVEKGVAELTVDGDAIDLASGPIIRPELVSGKRAVEVKVRLRSLRLPANSGLTEH